MKIPAEILNQWRIEREHGDVKKISEYVGVHRETIREAIYSGHTTEETFNGICKFFSEKRKAKNALIKKALK